MKDFRERIHAVMGRVVLKITVWRSVRTLGWRRLSEGFAEAYWVQGQRDPVVLEAAASSFAPPSQTEAAYDKSVFDRCVSPWSLTTMGAGSFQIGWRGSG